jgi:hypothetical protein
VALIGGGAGLVTGAVTGAISAIIAPWAKWGVDKKRLAQERRVERIKEWRDGVGHLDWQEDHHGQTGAWDTQLISADIHSQSWYVTLRPEMAREVVDQVEKLNDQPVPSRRGKISKLVKHEITRIEREKWKLV